MTQLVKHTRDPIARSFVSRPSFKYKPLSFYLPVIRLCDYSPFSTLHVLRQTGLLNIRHVGQVMLGGAQRQSTLAIATSY